jgi:hypothetical protein
MGLALLACREKLALIFGVIWHQKIKEGCKRFSLNFVNVEGVGLYCRDGVICSIAKPLCAQVRFGVGLQAYTSTLDLMNVQGGDV